jgi:hypothetical protein
MWNRSLIDGPITVNEYGEPDADGVRAVTGTVPGYHLNLDASVYASLNAEDGSNPLDAYRAFPATPQQVFAGDAPEWVTVFLAFADEEEAKTVLADWWLAE